MTKKLPKAMFENYIELGDTKIPCAVLEGEIRVLTQEGFLGAIGRAKKAKGGTGASKVDGMPAFLAANNLKPFITSELVKSTSPIVFRTLSGPKAYGYHAELLPQVCQVYLDARDAGVLTSQQEHIAATCEILIRGLATIGIIGLIDEATGYQDIRARRALEKILDKYLRDEYGAWAKTFPDEFYKELFRLRGWSYIPFSVSRPSVVGRWTNDIIYARLAPGVLEELQSRNPADELGRRKRKHHQWLTEDVGHPRLREHLSAVIALMRASSNWNDFHRLLQRAFPKEFTTLLLPFSTKD